MHQGKLLHKLIYDHEVYNKTSIAKEMDMLRQNVQYHLKQEYLDSELLIKYAKILNVGMQIFFEKDDFFIPEEKKELTKEPKKGYLEDRVQRLEHEMNNMNELRTELFKYYMQIKDESIKNCCPVQVLDESA